MLQGILWICRSRQRPKLFRLTHPCPIPITLHSQALLVLETYADVNGFTAWQSEGQALYNAEFDEAIAKSVGITDTGG